EPVDLLIVGAGVIGLTAAWRCAQRGLRVRVVERARVGHGASTAAAGILAPADPAQLRGSEGADNLRAIELWPAFAAELEQAADTCVDLRRPGALHVVTAEDELPGLEAMASALAEAGVEHERLDPAGVARDEPGVRGALAGVLVPGDLSVATDRLVFALARACARAGVRIDEGVEPVALLREGGADGPVAGARLSDETSQPARLTLAAVGAWSGSAAWLPEAARPAVRPLAGEWLILHGDAVCHRVVRTPHGGACPRAGRRLWLGTTVREAGFPECPRADAIAAILANWAEVLPAVGGLEIERVGVGLRPKADGGPVVGASPVPGLAVAAGHGREGIIHAPLAGAAVAELAAGTLGRPAEKTPKPDQT
ncbi:MAG TPA: FAD-dependent oxidoreductase, partial [Capillimicrobium sp.]